MLQATRLDWVYTTNKSFIAQVRDALLLDDPASNGVVTTALNPQTPDQPWPNGGPATTNIGQSICIIYKYFNISPPPFFSKWLASKI